MVNENAVDAGMLLGFVTLTDTEQVPPSLFAETVLLQVVVAVHEKEAVSVFESLHAGIPVQVAFSVPAEMVGPQRFCGTGATLYTSSAIGKLDTVPEGWDVYLIVGVAANIELQIINSAKLIQNPFFIISPDNRSQFNSLISRM